MKLVRKFRLAEAALIVTSAFLTAAAPVMAQDYQPPPSFSSEQVDNLVSRIALYPDPLLAQIFAAASFPDQIADAARWAGQYRNLSGDQLADAMYQANLQFDPAVQALIPFPTVLDMMAADPNWTSALGNAVLANQPAVMDAVQRMRRTAQQYGYLQSNQQVQVTDNGAGVEIEPVDPSYIAVPVYDPYVVYARPRPGFFIGGAIGFGSGFSIGAFDRWGWGGGFNWRNHAVIVNHSVWGRNWNNRGGYVHNYGNWDRGTWRNNYRPNAYVNRGGNGFSNSGNYNRGNRAVPLAPSAPGRNYDRGGFNQFRGNDRQVAPSAPARNYDRGSFNQFRGNARQAAPIAPSAPARSSDRGNFNRQAAPAAPVAPSAPARNYDRGSFNQFRGNARQAAPVAPSAPARSFDRGNFNRQAAPAAPSAPARNFDRGNSNHGGNRTEGHSDRGSHGRR